MKNTTDAEETKIEVTPQLVKEHGPIGAIVLSRIRDITAEHMARTGDREFEYSLMDIAQQVGMPKSTVHKAIQRLKDKDLVASEEARFGPLKRRMWLMRHDTEFYDQLAKHMQQPLGSPDVPSFQGAQGHSPLEHSQDLGPGCDRREPLQSQARWSGHSCTPHVERSSLQPNTGVGQSPTPSSRAQPSQGPQSNEMNMTDEDMRKMVEDLMKDRER